MLYQAIPDLLDEHRLAIVQEQIKHLAIELYRFEVAVQALPLDDAALPQMAANVARTSAILAGYRAIEAELIGLLNAGAAA